MLLCAPLGALVVEGEPQPPAPLLEMKQGAYEVHPQRNRYEMRDGLETVLREEREKRGGGEIES